MRFPWSVSGADRLVQAAGTVGGGGAGIQERRTGLIGGFEKSIREVLLLSVSMLLVLFNLLDGEKPRQP